MLKVEKLSLFLPTKLFFSDSLSAPGGLLSYAGVFLTQFFHIPWLGSTIFLLLLVIVAYLVKTTFSIRAKAVSLIFIPSLLLLLIFTQLGYIIYINKSPGIAFSNILGIIVALIALGTYKSMHGTKPKVVFTLLFIALLYPLIGFYAIFAGILFFVNDITVYCQNHKKDDLHSILGTLIVTIFIPVLYYKLAYTHLNPLFIYSSGLPQFLLNKKEIILWMPLFILFFSIVLMTVFSIIKKEKSSFAKRPFLWSFTAFLFIVLYVFKFSYNDDNFRTEIKMLDAVYNNNWKETLSLSAKVEDEPSRMIVMLTNLALRETGMAGDKMFTYKNGDRRYKSPRKVMAIRMAGLPVYYNYAKLNYAYRWGIENIVEYGMNIETLQYLVKVCTFNGEYALAQKYNDVLKRTLFYKDLAEEYQTYIDKPSLIVGLPEFKNIIGMYAYKNSLGGDYSSLESFLLYSTANLTNGSLLMGEMSLQCNLIIRKIPPFWPRFFYYVQNHKRIPVHYQEAALLYAYLENNVDISKIKFDTYVKNRFNEFTKLVTKFQNENKSEEEGQEMFRESFGDTFWYYYFFMNDLQIEHYKE